MIDPRFLDALRARITLSDVIGRRVRLTRAGSEVKGCCPFHNEKTASFYVNDQKGFAHCFGCGAHVDAVGFLMRAEGLSFPEAVEDLAAVAGLEVPAVTPEERVAAARKRDLLEVAETICAWFEKRLWTEDGAAARAYLESRGLSADTMERFRLGWAPDDWDALRRHLTDLGIPEEDGVAVGALKARRPEEDGRQRAPFALFRRRVIFPIPNPAGRVVGFGGRILPDHPDTDAPKYLNSPEGPLFDKGRLLYNGGARLQRAAADGQTPLVVEGYLDVIQLVQAGLEATVAPLGTALGEEQLRLLWKRLPADRPRVPVLVFDGDKAGRAAALRAAERALPLLEPGCSLRFAALPDGEDPDSLVRAGGANALAPVLKAARPLVDVLWQALTHEPEDPEALRDLSTPEAKASVVRAVEERLGAIGDNAVFDAYRDELLARCKAVLGFRPKLPARPTKSAAEPGGPASTPPVERPLPEAEDCPVLVLGCQGKVHAYLKPRGDFFDLLVKEHTETGIAALFGGDVAWLEDRFPVYDNRGNLLGIDYGGVRNWLFRLANRLAPFDAVATVRGAGLWPDGQGGIIVHCGDEVRVGPPYADKPVWLSAGRRIGEHVYPREPGMSRPAGSPGKAGDWAELRDVLASWNWKDPPRDVLANLGWLANGMLAGVAPWHCALYNTGGSGAGKSALLELYGTVLGRGWSVAVSKPTEAALRQKLGAAAKVALIDEIEQDELSLQARAVAELVRLSTDPKQAATARGSAGGTARDFPIRAAIYLTSILRPPLQQQDLNRMTICDLDPMEADVEARARLRQDIARFAELSPGMRTRMLTRWAAFERTRDVFELALASFEYGPEKRRHKARQLDALGTLLTCAWLALNDGDPKDTDADDWVRLFPPDERAGLGEESSDPWQCLQHLLTSSPEKKWIQNTYRRVTIAELINDWRVSPGAPFELGAYGLGLWKHPDTGQWCLVVANSHVGLEEIYKGTRWAQGVWVQSLDRLPGKLKANKPLSFKGSKQRGTWLPLDLFVPDGRDAAEDEAESVDAHGNGGRVTASPAPLPHEMEES